jgi:CDP-6-deoxy-D-xylo-4-hexulose-3-dehydrase
MRISLIKSSFFQEEEAKKGLTDFIAHAEQLSMGAQCAAFEEGFAAKQETAHAVFVSNGSMANLILIQALLNVGRLKPGATVGVSALTWSTNVMPLLQLGLTVRTIDCEQATLNVSSATLEEHLHDLDALFLTNVLGFCSDLDVIVGQCATHDVLLLEDNCESLGSRFDSKLLGNFGEASTFSFFVGHHLSTIEGGMICTNDDALHEMLLITRAHGWDRNLSDAQQLALRQEHNVDPFMDQYTFYELGYNSRPMEMNGFLGNQQLQHWDTIVENRASNFDAFQRAIAASEHVYKALDVSHMELVSNFAMQLICTNEGDAIACRKRFTDADVEIRPIIAGDINEQPFYKKHATVRPCPNAQHIHTNGFYFPNNPELTPEEVEVLCALL